MTEYAAKSVYIYSGGDKMTYKDILESAAREFNTTPDEIEKEMSAAVKSAGLNISPELFIALAAQETKKRIKNKQAVPKRG